MKWFKRQGSLSTPLLALMALVWIGFLCPAAVYGQAPSPYPPNNSQAMPLTDESPAAAEEVATPKWLPEMLTSKKLSKREAGLEVKGVIPELTAQAGALKDPINKAIEAVVNSKITAAWESKAKQLTFEYAVYDTAAVVSIVIKSTVTTASSKTEVVSVNFDPADGRLLQMNEAVDRNIARLADKLLTERIRQNPTDYIHGFDGLSADQAFYMTDESVVFQFSEYQLAAGSKGIDSLEILLKDVASVTIVAYEYYTRPDYSIKMVPLRQVCEGLGYEVVWSAAKEKVFIYKNGAFVMELTPGVNNYIRDKKLMRSLETAPEIRYNSTMYVPISFFDQILSLITYSIDDAENIIFSAYTETAIK